MIYAIITILVIGLILFIASFFMNSRLHDLEDQVEQLSISTLQDRYIIKNKIKVLEEELLTDTMDLESLASNKGNNSNELVNNVQRMYLQGYEINQIADKTGLSKEDIQTIVQKEKDSHSLV
ncbi:hypothetical protein CEY16_04375 [Halalkalibacillus sediminis]|uniref:Resolvase HTH domain-containing protein n=1 Tax=Halalkalibacillus sediminis TaxID=2018042 RepID=A0A2I0QXE8_9BACI|nr:hypothetical protein [Halalkalibacillus sediminis]PKR78995.1 hypothetical protein CEY16_04375 [Halalkalibacillus sediminis]